MTPHNLQATFPAATEQGDDSGWIIARHFLIGITDRVWRNGHVAVSSTDVQTILLAAIDIANETNPS